MDGLPTWLRSESKEDWAARFASINRRDDLEDRDLTRDEDGLTQKEEREAKWAEENDQAEAMGMDKVQMRQYYKVSHLTRVPLPSPLERSKADLLLCDGSVSR